MTVSPYPRIVLTAERAQCRRDLARARTLLEGSASPAARAVLRADRDLYERRLADLDRVIAVLEEMEQDEQPPTEEELREGKRIAGQRRRAAGAARRLVEFVGWFGSGDIWEDCSGNQTLLSEDIVDVCRVVLGEVEVPRAKE